MEPSLNLYTLYKYINKFPIKSPWTFKKNGKFTKIVPSTNLIASTVTGLKLPIAFVDFWDFSEINATVFCNYCNLSSTVFGHSLTTPSRGWEPNTLKALMDWLSFPGVTHRTTACWPIRVLYSSMVAFSFLYLIEKFTLFQFWQTFYILHF